MEARSTATALCLLTMLTIAGCPLFTGGPAARPRDSKPADVDEPPQVVTTRASQDVKTAAAVEAEMDPVLRWIERVQRRDELHARAPAPPSEREAATQPAYDPGWPGSNVARHFDDSPVVDTERPADNAGVSSSAPKHGAEPKPAQATTRPVLTGVTVRGGQQDKPHAAPEPAPTLSANTPAKAATTAPLTLTEFVEQYHSGAEDTTFQAQLDKRLLFVLAGKYEQARRPLEAVSREQQQMALHLVDSLIAIREAHGGEPSAEANRVLEELSGLEQSLVPLGDLRIPRLEITRAVRGFGQFDPFDPPAFQAGHAIEFVVYCEVGNFVSRDVEGGGYESRFSMRTAVFNRSGDVVVEMNDDNITDRCRARRRDCFISALVRLPATLSPGEYVVKTTIVDKIGEKVAQKRATFRVVARS